jgi:hypothetical protein
MVDDTIDLFSSPSLPGPGAYLFPHSLPSVLDQTRRWRRMGGRDKKWQERS